MTPQERYRRTKKGRATALAWKKAHPKKVALAYRKHHLKTAYGLSLSAFQALKSVQKSRCAICGKKPRQLVVDHDHTTKKVRGLLCSDCNLGLGKLGDSAAGLTRAVRYLQRTAK